MLRTRERTSRGPATYEFALVVVALYVLSRVPVLFFRLRTAEILGGPVRPYWSEDAIIRGTFLLVELAVIAVAVRVCSLRSLLRQWPLAGFLAIVLVSTAWSVEPDITGPHSLMFVATAAVGWYLGERFRPGQQALVVASVGGVAAVVSVIALFVWPEFAKTSDGYPGIWSGVYINRNILGLAMATGLLSLAFAIGRLRGVALSIATGIGVLEAFLLLQTRSRTGLVALGITVACVAFVSALRALFGRRLTVRQGAMVTLLAGGAGGYWLHSNWGAVLSWLGREATLTSRTTIWAIVRGFIAQRPYWGWGFEAIWSHPPAVEQAAASYGFAHAHSAYYEVMLGTGKVGFVLFIVALLVTAWRLFAHAWRVPGVEGVWPLALGVFVAVNNLSESFLGSNEAVWALLVCAGVTASRPASARVRVPKIGQSED